MICLTGDVHHASLQTNDQRHIAEPGVTEAGVTRRYVELLEKHGVKATLYICGRCFTEEWDTLEPVADHPLVEVGGHMFNARFPRECFDAYGERTGLWNGPCWYQDWDIRRTIDAARERTGRAIVAWRNHSYKTDVNTHELLARHGLALVSDTVEPDAPWPRRIARGLIEHPLNVIPDHDHLYHAHRTRAFVERANARGYGADPFGAVSYRIDEWGELALRQASAIDALGGVATILCHPLCMWIADRFRTFEQLLEEFARRHTIFARDIIRLVDHPPAALATTRTRARPTGRAPSRARGGNATRKENRR